MRDAKRSLIIFLCIIVFVLWIGSLIFLGISIYENFEVIKEALWELLKTITIIFGAIIAVFIILGEGPPEIPEVEYAEFPFEVVYSIDVEQAIVLLSICSGVVGIRIVWISKDLQIRAVSCKQLVSFVKLLCDSLLVKSVKQVFQSFRKKLCPALHKGRSGCHIG